LIKNFLFVVPRYAKVNEYYPFPYGLGYVIANMKKNGFNVLIVNLCHHEEPIEVLLSEAIKKHDIHVVCSGAMSIHWNELEEVLTTVKKINHDIITVVGGAIVTSDPLLALENLQIDFGIIGEGEETIVELADALCNNKDTKMIRGIGFLDDNKEIFLTGPRPPIKDLDSLPFPDYDGLGFDTWLKINSQAQKINWLEYDLHHPQKQVDIFASRSCPYRCTFCYHPLGNKYRQRSLDSVFKEIEYLRDKYGVTLINFQDELFSVNKERVYDFTSRIKKYDIEYFIQWRVDNIDEGMLQALKDSGVRYLELGVESMSDVVLKSMKKGTTKQQIEQAYTLCEKIGVRVISNIIIGDVAETEDTIKESLDWVKDHPQHDINIGFILAIPDSELWRYALSKGLIKDKLEFIKNRFPVINLTSIDDKRFLEIKHDVMASALKKENIVYGQLLSTKKANKFYQDKQVYDFTAKCPVCSKLSDYSYIKYSDHLFSIVVCKHCLKRFKVPTRETFEESFFTELKKVILLNIKIVYISLLIDNSYLLRLRNLFRRT